MSVRVQAAVWERYPTGGGEMMLALALADHAHDDGAHIFPKVASLAQKTRQSARTVQYQLGKMQAAGWLLLVGEGHGGRGVSREYRINPDWLKGADLAPFSDGQKGATTAAPFDAGKGAMAAAPFGGPGKTERVQSDAQKGATAIAPAIEPEEPSVIHTPLPPLQGEPGLPSIPAVPNPEPPVKAKRRKGREPTDPQPLLAYLEGCKAAGAKPVPAEDAVWQYADKVGLPPEFIALQWATFKRKFLAQPRKRQADWRHTFRNSVESGWYGLWFVRADGAYALTTAGTQAQRLVDAEAAGDGGVR